MFGVSRALSGLTRDDLFFSPGYNSPLFCTARFVFTIYDLSDIYCPENSNPLIRLYYATVMKRGCRRALSILYSVGIYAYADYRVVGRVGREGLQRRMRG